MGEIKGPVTVGKQLREAWGPWVMSPDGEIVCVVPGLDDAFDRAAAEEIADALNAREELALLRAIALAIQAAEQRQSEEDEEADEKAAAQAELAIDEAWDSVFAYYAAHPETLEGQR